MDTGVGFAYHAFGHLENKETLIFIALYTSFLVYVDSAFVRDNRNLRVFTERFIRNERQMDPVLESLSGFIQEIPNHWEPVVASIILTGTLNFINAPTLEYQTQGMKVESSFLCRAAKFYKLVLRHLPMQMDKQALPVNCLEQQNRTH